jgi:large subunit ribosomal protein L1
MAHGKKYKKAIELLKGKEFYSLAEAVDLLKKTTVTKFNGTAEIHLNLNIDPTQADQTLRSTVALPHGTGKKLKIAAIVPDEKVKMALEAGATAAGLTDLIAEFEKGKIEYDVIVATPDVMKNLGKVAKTLGQKGMMPNPKSGTVSPDIVKTIQELTKGRVEFRNDKEGNIHAIFGKLSFKEEELLNNLKSFLMAIRDAKPTGVKGTYINSITINSTMGPGIKLDTKTVMGELPK